MFGLDVGGLHLVATDMTRWAQGITAVVTHPTDKPATDAAAAQDVPVEELFTLELTAGTTTEPKYEFVTVGPKGNRIDAALAGSALARVALFRRRDRRRARSRCRRASRSAAWNSSPTTSQPGRAVNPGNSYELSLIFATMPPLRPVGDPARPFPRPPF